MENLRHLKLFVVFLAGTLLVFPLFVLAYSDKTTHPALTSEIVGLFNKTYPSLALKDAEKMLLMRGSTEEDAGARPLQHFFDPIYNRGLTIAGNEWIKAPAWAEGTLAQASYAGNLAKIPGISALYGTAYEMYSGDTDYSWERAVFDYTWGDKERGLLALGHILHLVEDMSVPDHTRNDPHPEFAEAAFGGPSPYESFANQFTPDTISLNSLKNGGNIPQRNSLEEYLSALAEYSNKNFFSKDSIIDTKYRDPYLETTQLKRIGNRKFGINTSYSGQYYLFVVEENPLSFEENYQIEDPNNLILSDYWRLLSREAVVNGAGVIKLFFDEVAKERETKALALKNRNWAQKVYDKTASVIYGIAGKLYGTSVPYEELNTPGTETVRLKTGGTPQGAAVTLSPSNPARSGLPLPAHTESVDSQRVRPDLAPSMPDLAQFDLVQNNEASSVLNGASEALFNSTPNPYEPGFGGGGVPPPPVSSPPTPLPPPSPPPPPPSSDTTPPDITLAPCGGSLATSGCLVATTTFNFSWSSNADDLDHFVINKNGVEETTTATSTEVTASDNSVYTFSVKAVDATGNESAPETQTIEIATTPVVINEIAWMGTAASADDEWIELYNPTAQEVSLAGWILRAGDGTPTIGLTDTIPAGGYYILERTDDMTVSDISANQIYGNDGASSALVNTGEELFLERVANGATTTIDKTPAGCSNWCNKGNNTTKQTMERIDARASGADSANWATALGEFIQNGKDANGFTLNGTPKAKNSVSYLVSANSSRTVTANKTLTVAESPYLIDRPGLTINAGATLTLEPGVVVKITRPQEPKLTVRGAIIANGTALNPVVFTSFADDLYGGDMNADGATTTPAAGDWSQILIESPSAGSSFTNTLIRYGGTWFTGATPYAAIVVSGASASFDTVTVEYAAKYGLYLKNSGSQITNSIFTFNKRNGGTGLDAAGMYVDGVFGGAPSVSGSTFLENDFGIRAISAPGLTATGNTFTNNSTSAIHVTSALGSFSGNSGDGNALNAIVIGNGGMITGVGTTVLSANSLPYLVQGGAEVNASTTLAIADGVVIKGYADNSASAGKITVKPGASITGSGASASSIIFTSSHDDAVGGDVTGNGASTTPAAGDWYGITVENGGFLNMSGLTLRYAGGLTTQSGDDKGGIKITGDVATSTIANALFDSNYQYGAHVRSGGALTVSNTTFQNHTNGKTADYAAVFVNNSFTTLSDIIFGNNTKWDIRAFGAGYSVTCTNCGTPAPVTSPDPL
ncbi:MAG: lamin tail domain-containing protein [Parcubacteria group bacterium]|nr:lamin tail domain-containing protein [Parcubacteria group bacterium]MBI2049242.1 lamin tail domain-containing protein [Parcubacteria group bacterium]